MLSKTLEKTETAPLQPSIQPNCYREVVNKMQDSILLFNNQMTIIESNDNTLETRGKLLSDIIPATSIQKLSALCNDRNQSHLIKGEFNVDKNTNKTYFEFQIHTNIQDGIHLAILSDMTKYKKLELEKMHVASQFESIANHVPDCFWSTLICEDGSYKVTYVSPGWKEIWGYEPEDIYRDPALWTTLILPEFREAAEKINLDVMTSKKRQTIIFAIKNKKGEIRWIEDRITPVFNDNNHVVSFDGIARDITKQRIAEEKLHQQLAELAHVSRLNIANEMASCIAHEINQPLSSIANYAGGCLARLDGDKVNPKILVAIKKIIYQVEYAGQVIHRLKNFLQKSEVQKQHFHINSLVNEALALIEFEITSKNIKVDFDLALELPLVNVDKIQIEQVILCIIRNAIEAIENEKSLQANIKITTLLNKNNLVQVSIADNGRGVSKNIRERIFQSFYSTKKMGMGIGLPISKSIIEMHYGQIWFEEAPFGSGSQFCFTLTQRGDVANEHSNSLDC